MNNIIASNKTFGEGFKISPSAYIECKELIIGRDVIIDERVRIICKNGTVKIGDQTFIGNDTSIILQSFTIGEYSKLHNHSLLNGKKTVSIGDNCWIGQNCVLNGEEDLVIGNNVGIGTYSSVWTHGYFGQLIDGCSIFSIKSTIIEDDAWLVGSYNTIFPGVTVGKKSVLMGTSVVTKSMLPGKIYGGNPAKDISDKVGSPYKEIEYLEKIEIIKYHLKNYFQNNLIEYIEEDLKISVIEKGDIIFNYSDDPIMCSNDSVHFFEEVKDWSKSEKTSKFCLKKKQYQKNYTQIEILIKKILNPVVARFIPKEND